MDGLFFMMSIAGVGLVVWWVIRNDQVRPGGTTYGLFAMRQSGVAARQPRRRRPRLLDAQAAGEANPVAEARPSVPPDLMSN